MYLSLTAASKLSVVITRGKIGVEDVCEQVGEGITGLDLKRTENS